MSKCLLAPSCRVLKEGTWLAQLISWSLGHSHPGLANGLRSPESGVYLWSNKSGYGSQGEHGMAFPKCNLTLKLLSCRDVGMSLCPRPHPGQGHHVDKKLMPLTYEVWPWTLRDLKKAWLPMGFIYYPWILQNKIYLSYVPSWVSGLCLTETTNPSCCAGMKRPKIYPFGCLILQLLLPAGL